MTTTARVYLAGPMTHIPQFNFPLFDTATKRLRELGWDVISPHEQDAPEVQAAAWASPDGELQDGLIAGRTWGDILAKDVKLVADDVGGIVFLPHWQKSRGARLEALVGILTNKIFFLYSHTYGPSQVPIEYVKSELSRSLAVENL